MKEHTEKNLTAATKSTEQLPMEKSRPPVLGSGGDPFRNRRVPHARSEELPRAFFVGNGDLSLSEEIFTPEVISAFGQEVRLGRHAVTPASYGSFERDLLEAEILIATWGFPNQLAEGLSRLPKLKLVLYAGGSVKGFAAPFLEKGITVVGGAKVNALAVAEFCLAQIILATKGYFRNTRMCRHHATARHGVAFAGPGNNGETVALIGYGAIARRLRTLLRSIRLRVLVVDPWLSKEEARAEEIIPTSLERAFTDALVVSNHLPDFPDLEHAINAKHFRMMRLNATFLNTGRGRQVNEEDLARVFSERPDLTALLDVTHPEPPPAGCPLFGLSNVQLSSHIAGLIGQERTMVGDLILEELRRYRRGVPLHHSIRLEQLEIMA